MARKEQHYKEYKEQKKEDYTILKKDNPWLAEVDSTALQSAREHLDIAYERFLKKNIKKAESQKKEGVQAVIYNKACRHQYQACRRQTEDS